MTGPARPHRIVSLLPSATDILHALGAGHDLVGITFECDLPPEHTPAVVSSTSLPRGLTPGEIDRRVAESLAKGEDLYHLDRDALRDLGADLVVTQDLCEACAVDVSDVGAALAHLGTDAEVLTLDPRTLDDVLATIVTLGRATGRDVEAAALVVLIRARIEHVSRRVADRERPRVAVLEWTDPPYGPGHWLPEMVHLAGGEPVIGWPGEPSRRVTFEEVADARPDVVVVAPCGYRLDLATELAAGLISQDVLPPGVRVHPVDADAHWVRPGPGLVDGIEELAAYLHPHD